MKCTVAVPRAPLTELRELMLRRFDTATRVPLMVKVPWKPGSQGQRTASL